MRPTVFRVTNNLNVGGVQRRLRALLPLLTDDFNVHIVTYRQKGIFFKELADLNVHTHFIPRSGKWDPIAISKLAHLFRTHNAQIAHGHSFGGNIFSSLAAAMARVPVRIGQVHSRGLHWYGKTAIRRKKQALEEAIVHRFFTDRIIFASEEARCFFQENTKITDNKLEILYNGIDIKSLTPKNSRDKILSRHNIPSSHIVVGWIGRITEGKGIDLLVDLASATYSQKLPITYLVVGDGGGLDAFKNHISNKGLSSSIICAGQTSTPGDYYNAFNILMFTSPPAHESLPGVVLEACVAGIPILARFSKTIEEITLYASNITFFDDLSTMAQKISIVQEMSQKRFHPTTQFIDHFSIEAMKKNTINLYQKLLTQKQKKTS